MLQLVATNLIHAQSTMTGLHKTPVFKAFSIEKNCDFKRIIRCFRGPFGVSVCIKFLAK